ncbi:MAG: flagellar filament capping protein FliD [Solirubrobacteraceae bacterium]
MSTPNLDNLTIGQSSSTTAPISIPGLASGLNSAAIISAMIQLDSQPMYQVEIEQVGVNQQATQLGQLQTALEAVAGDAQNLSGPGLFDTTQSVSSSNPTTITATATTGAAIGGYQVAVSQLATSAQRTYTYAPPASGDTIKIDGKSVTVAAESTMQDFVNQINNDSNLDVEAAITGTNTLVLSSTSTGNNGTSFIQVSDPGGALTEQTADAVNGQDAEFTINGNPTVKTSTSNTVTDAIPGVTMTLGGVTTSASGPVTIVVSPPAASTTNIETAINQFVSDYNTAVNAIETQLTQAPVTDPQNTSDAEKGPLYDDDDLAALLSNMRQMMYTPGSGLPNGMAALSDIGITTGAPSGNASPSASSVAGDLTVDTATLAAAIQSNPNGVQAILNSFSQSFQTLVNDEAGPGGVIASRISDDTDESTEMSYQISTMQANLSEQQTQLQDEYNALESTISLSDSSESSLLSEIAQLPTGNTTY